MSTGQLGNANLLSIRVQIDKLKAAIRREYIDRAARRAERAQAEFDSCVVPDVNAIVRLFVGHELRLLNGIKSFLKERLDGFNRERFAWERHPLTEPYENALERVAIEHLKKSDSVAMARYLNSIAVLARLGEAAQELSREIGLHVEVLESPEIPVVLIGKTRYHAGLPCRLLRTDHLESSTPNLFLLVHDNPVLPEDSAIGTLHLNMVDGFSVERWDCKELQLDPIENAIPFIPKVEFEKSLHCHFEDTVRDLSARRSTWDENSITHDLLKIFNEKKFLPIALPSGQRLVRVRTFKQRSRWEEKYGDICFIVQFISDGGIESGVDYIEAKRSDFDVRLFPELKPKQLKTILENTKGHPEMVPLVLLYDNHAPLGWKCVSVPMRDVPLGRGAKKINAESIGIPFARQIVERFLMRQDLCFEASAVEEAVANANRFGETVFLQVASGDLDQKLLLELSRNINIESALEQTFGIGLRRDGLSRGLHRGLGR